MAALRRGTEVTRFENRYVRSDDAVRRLEWSARPMLERGLIYAAARDVTDTRMLGDEQAALRRVATLVAEGHDPRRIFEAVAIEVGRLLGADATRLLRYEQDGATSVVASYGVSEPADEAGSRLSAPIVVSGRRWGVIEAAWEHGGLARADTGARMEQFTELVATAVANAESSAALTASRRRIVTTADETRRRIERDLHDGAQQRLVHAIIALKLARGKLSGDGGPTAELLDESLQNAQRAIEDIRELAQGIHPAVLTDRGLGPALDAIAARCPVPVDLDVRLDGRLPEPIEVAIYYVVSEALTNVAKHAHASTAEVCLDRRDGGLLLTVSDDGVGGADPAAGSGLVGLRDRVEATGGTLTVESASGQGTRLTVALPLQADAPAPVP
jgi:signal transduction histidine kinase